VGRAGGRSRTKGGGRRLRIDERMVGRMKVDDGGARGYDARGSHSHLTC
jgi:hypothetical protein